MADLVTLTRAKRSCAGATSGDDALLGDLISACSAAAEAFCGRLLSQTSLDELYPGWTPDGLLLLREYPVAAVASVRCGRRTVLRVRNASSANQQAVVAVTSAGLTLTRTASGTTTTDTTVTFAGYPTLAGMAAAVTALGDGWEGRAVAGYELYPSADLFVTPRAGGQSQGARNALADHAGLTLHTEHLAGFTWDPRGWLNWPGDGWGGTDLQRWEDDGGRPAAPPGEYGPDAWRVKYTAGPATVAFDVQEAVALWVSHLWKVSGRDALLSQQSSADASSDGGAGTTTSSSASSSYRSLPPMPEAVRGLLLPHKRRTV